MKSKHTSENAHSAPNHITLPNKSGYFLSRVRIPATIAFQFVQYCPRKRSVTNKRMASGKARKKHIDRVERRRAHLDQNPPKSIAARVPLYSRRFCCWHILLIVLYSSCTSSPEIYPRVVGSQWQRNEGTKPKKQNDGT